MADDLTPERRTEVIEYEGMVLAPNACATCGKWFPPLVARMPKSFINDYCWGHEPNPDLTEARIEERLIKAVDVIEGAPKPT